MKKQMERTVYEAPVTERFQVELEGSFCGSADIENPNNPNTGRIDEQKVNDNFTAVFEASFGDDNNWV